MLGILLATLLPLTTALQWSDSLTNKTAKTVCSASDIHLPWNFTLSPSENIKDTKWIHRAENGSDILIASLAAGQFTPTPAFSGRVQWTGQAGIVVTGAGVAQSGNYTVTVRTQDSSNQTVVFSKSASVLVADAPKTESGVLHVRQESDAEFDETTGQWRVLLTCGVFTSLGHPPVHVVWTTPDGQTMESSDVLDGKFRLLLPTPTPGGNYTCTLPPLSPATRCLPPLSPLLEGATITVDEVKASLTLMEAKLLDTQKELMQLRNDFSIPRNTTLSARANPVPAPATTRVSFHARLSSTISNTGILKPFITHTNDGGAFSATSGYFTAPRTGTYFFAVSAGTWSRDKYVYMYLRRDNSIVSQAVTRQYSGYMTMGSMQAVLYLSTNQRVWVDSGSSFGYYHASTTWFTGFQIY